MTNDQEVLELRREVAELRREVAELRLAALYQAPRTIPLSPTIAPSYPTGPWWGGARDNQSFQFDRRFGDDYRGPLGLAGSGGVAQ